MKTEGWFPDKTVYQKKKEDLLKQEQLVKQDIVVTDDKQWDRLFEKLMNFTERVKELYERKDPMITRIIVEIIGSNFILEGQKLKIKAKNAFVVLQAVKEDFYKRNLWLEPKDGLLQSPKDSVSHPQFLFGTAYGSRTRDFWDENPTS